MSIHHNQRLQSMNRTNIADMIVDIVVVVRSFVCSFSSSSVVWCESIGSIKTLGQHNGLNDLLIYTHIDRFEYVWSFRSFFAPIRLVRNCTFSVWHSPLFIFLAQLFSIMFLLWCSRSRYFMIHLY